MAADPPLISIIVLTYESSKYVLETLESINNQTYRTIELIITDDASQDETVAICKKWLRDNNSNFNGTKLLTCEVNTGTALNLNRGIDASNGEWIKIIAGDDALYPYILQEYVDFINSNPKIEFIHSQAVPFSEDFKECNELPMKRASNYKINKKGITPKEQSQILLRICLISAATVMIKSNIFKRIGFFSEDYPLWEDRPMWYRLAKNGIKLNYLDIKGAKYRVRRDSVANNKTSNTQISQFAVYKSRALLDTLIHELPLHEKILKYIAYTLYIKFSQFDSRSFMAKFFYSLTVFPLMVMVHRLDQKYR